MAQIGTFVQEAGERPRWVTLQNTTVGSVMNSRAMKIARVTMNPVAADNISWVWRNPEITDILVTRVILYITTETALLAVMDVGVVNAPANTANGIFAIAALSTVAPPHTLDNLALLPAIHKVAARSDVAVVNQYITGYVTAAATAVDLVGTVRIEYTEV